MKASQTAYALIKAKEKFMGSAYLCPAGCPTIGWGHTKDVKLGMRITQEIGEQLLKEDVGEVEEVVNRLVTAPLNQNQYDALVDFIFNEGVGHFFTSTLRKLVNNKEYDSAANEFRKWVFASVKGQLVRLPGLVVRRKDEEDLFRKKV